ncbi:hypothetical protein [Streptomyces sp. NPDC054975]
MSADTRPTVRLIDTAAGVAGSGTPAGVRRELLAVNGLMAEHPTLPAFGAVDFADVPQRGSVVMVWLPDRDALRAWARALCIVAEYSGRSHYGRTEPTATSATLHDWLWWNVLYADADVNGVPVRFWTLETSGHPRVAELAVAARIPGRAET